MEGERQRVNMQSRVQSLESRSQRQESVKLHLFVCLLWTLFALLWSLLTPISASAQMTSGGWIVSLYGMVQVEPGNGVTTLKVRDEHIRFVIHNIQCSDRNFSTGRFLSDVTNREPGLYIKGPEEWLDLLINERPGKRILQMRGAYHPDSRMLFLHKLERFQGTPTPK